MALARDLAIRVLLVPGGPLSKIITPLLVE